MSNVIKLESVKPQKWENGCVSFSRYSTYHSCARKFQYKYIDKVEEPKNKNFELGKAVHKFCELYHNGVEFDKAIVDCMCYELEDKDKDMIETMAKLYIEVELPYEIKYTEMGIRHQNYYGILDFIGTDNITGEIIAGDYKTSARMPSQMDLAVAKQRALYSYILSEEYDIDINTFFFIYFIKTKKPKIAIFPTAVTTKEIDNVKSWLVGTQENIRTDRNFVANHSSMGCNMCSYKTLCLRENLGKELTELSINLIK